MKALPQRTFSFDSRSVMLFAALSIGGAGGLQAQSTAGSPRLDSAPSAIPPATGPFTPRGVGAATSAAFTRADTDQDNKLSAKEAVQLPAISERFDEIDTDHDGSLSRAEFELGAQS